MHFIIDRNTLAGLLKKVVPATSTDGTLPVFSCVRIEVSNGILTLYATDNKVSIRSSEACEVIEPGSLGVNGKSFQDIVSKIQNGNVIIKMNGERMQIKSGRAAVHLNVIAEDSFPTGVDYRSLEFIQAIGFFKVIDRVKFAASSEDNGRPYLMGVRITSDHMAATDGHRLAMAAHKYKIKDPITVQADLLNRVQKALGEDVEIAITEAQIHFKSKSTYASVTILAGQYPNYLQIIPSSPSKEASCEIGELKSALALIKAAADQKQLTVSFEFGENRLFASTKSESAEAFQELPCKTSAVALISFNVSYIADVLDRLTGTEIIMEIRNNLLPLVIKEEGYVNLVMPKRNT